MNRDTTCRSRRLRPSRSPLDTPVPVSRPLDPRRGGVDHGPASGGVTTTGTKDHPLRLTPRGRGPRHNPVLSSPGLGVSRPSTDTRARLFSPTMCRGGNPIDSRVKVLLFRSTHGGPSPVDLLSVGLGMCREGDRRGGTP